MMIAMTATCGLAGECERGRRAAPHVHTIGIGTPIHDAVAVCESARGCEFYWAEAGCERVPLTTTIAMPATMAAISDATPFQWIHAAGSLASASAAGMAATQKMATPKSISAAPHVRTIRISTPIH